MTTLRPKEPAAAEPRVGEQAEARAGRTLLFWALVIAVVFHGALLVSGSFEHTYDALIHIFFASHYAQNWFDPWEPRWYTGFFTIAYPPLSHYLVALLGKLLGLKPAFAVVQLGAVMGLTVGVYRFSSLLVNRRAAGYASLALVLSSAIAETVHVFGQLPTTLSLALLLNGIPFVWDYIKGGKLGDLVKATVWMSATTSAHHVTTLFGSVFFTGPIVVILLLQAFRMPRPGEPQGERFGQRMRRRLYRLLPRGYRTGVFGFLAISALLITVFPYWYWSRTDPIVQVTIPHASRENFLENTAAGLIFWIIPWASSLWALPYALYRGLFNWRWPVLASILLLFVLGTGGTTPIPRMLLRGAFDILTLDRFTFWATMLILPFLGMALESLLHGRLAAYLDANFGRRVRLLGLTGALAAMLAALVTISTLTRYRPFQPDPIDVDPIVTFIEKDEHWRFRYLTLGFGDQMAWLGANTRATTPDGNYHSARRLPELTTTPIERLEGAKFTGVPGIGSLEQFLTTPEKYHLKFVFSNDAFYDPLLFFSGWHRLGRLENGIMVWEREDIPPLPERLPRKTMPVYQRLMWGVLPLVMPILAMLLLLLPSWPSPLLPWQRRRPLRWWYLLLREDALPPQEGGAWQPWRRFLRPLEQVLDFSRRPLPTRLLRSVLLATVLLLPVALTVRRLLAPPATPEAVVLAYWDDIDFKRFGEAFAWLEPQQGLTLERFLLDISVQGGLRTGFAKLDSLKVLNVTFDAPEHPRPELGDQALVTTELTWLTALKEIREVRTQELVFTERGWRIEAAPLSKARSQERFAPQPDVAYYRTLRRLTTDVSAAGDVLDRPVLEVLEARLVAFEAPRLEFDHSGAPVRGEGTVTTLAIVGELRNIDARPADVTVTGVLRDAKGLELTRNNAREVMVHKLLPGETTPFLIRFDGVSAPADLAAVADFEVYAKAVVTGRNLERDLLVWSRFEDGELRADLYNVGTEEATIPHLLVALYDDSGVAWVEQHFGLEAVPPRERRTVQLAPVLPPGYRWWLDQVKRPVITDPSGVTAAAPPHTFLLPSVTGAGVGGYRVVAHAFYRTGGE